MDDPDQIARRTATKRIAIYACILFGVPGLCFVIPIEIYKWVILGATILAILVIGLGFLWVVEYNDAKSKANGTSRLP